MSSSIDDDVSKSNANDRSFQIITKAVKVNEIDLYTASADFSFNSTFELIFESDGSSGGFFTYFEVVFNKCHRPVVLSTSPSMPATHWRQTLFYLNDSLYPHVGEKIIGNISLRQFKHNFRDLEIKISGDLYTEFGTAKSFSNEFIVR